MLIVCLRLSYTLIQVCIGFAQFHRSNKWHKEIELWPLTWSSVMVNSKLGTAPQQVVMLKAGFGDPGAQE